MQPSRPSRTTPFLSTLSLRRATLMWWQSNTTIKISIHALLAESDSYHSLLVTFVFNFYPRSPCGERRQATYSSADSCIDFYPRSPCGERRESVDMYKISKQISIHALLAESDGDGFVYCDTDSVFLSTLSLRRATTLPITSNVVIRISIHALLAESDDPGKRSILYTLQISIHALLAESDIHICQIAARTDYFYPRSPCGERRQKLVL